MTHYKDEKYKEFGGKRYTYRALAWTPDRAKALREKYRKEGNYVRITPDEYSTGQVRYRIWTRKRD